MAYVSQAWLGERFKLAESDEASAVFGGTLKLRELTRAQFRTLRESARLGERAYTTHVNGEAILVTFDWDRWYAGLLAASAFDPATGQPLFPDIDAVLRLPDRPEVWAEIERLANRAAALSEVGAESLKSGGAGADAG